VCKYTGGQESKEPSCARFDYVAKANLIPDVIAGDLEIFPAGAGDGIRFIGQMSDSCAWEIPWHVKLLDDVRSAARLSLQPLSGFDTLKFEGCKITRGRSSVQTKAVATDSRVHSIICSSPLFVPARGSLRGTEYFSVQVLALGCEPLRFAERTAGCACPQ
jgi:hypothetical protein